MSSPCSGGRGPQCWLHVWADAKMSAEVLASGGRQGLFLSPLGERRGFPEISQQTASLLISQNGVTWPVPLLRRMGLSLGQSGEWGHFPLSRETWVSESIWILLVRKMRVCVDPWKATKRVPAL